MKAFFKSLIVLFAFFVVIQTGQAQEPLHDNHDKGMMHGLAMHDEPALGLSFKHFKYANPDAPKGGVLKQAEIGTFDNLNPNIIKGKAAAGSGLMFGRLMARSWDEPFTLYPWIAKGVEMPKDRKWMMFFLDERAKFSDGSPITATDVIFTFNTLKAKGRPNFRNVYGLVKDVIRHDQYTVEFRFSDKADLETPIIMGLMPVYSKAYWKDKDFEATTLEPFVSSGPYKVDNILPGRQITYSRIKDYWAKDIPSLKGQYNFDKMVFDYYRDENVMFQALQAGKLDYHLEQDPSRWQTQYNFSSLTDGTFEQKKLKHNRPEWVKAMIMNTRREPFKNIRVRRALSLAFDAEWVNRTFYQDQFNRIKSIYPNSELAFRKAMPPEQQAMIEAIGYDESFDERRITFMKEGSSKFAKNNFRQKLQQAKIFLERAGYKVNSSGTLIHNETKKPLKFEILLQDPEQEKVALFYASHLRKLGILPTIRSVDSAQFFARLNDFDFDMVFFKWHSTLSPGNEQLFYWGSKFVDLKGSRNYAGINSKLVDGLVSKMTSTQSRDELVTAARALDRTIMSGYYFVPLFFDGYDRILHKSYLKYPEYTSLYGPVIESWWAQNPVSQ